MPGNRRWTPAERSALRGAIAEAATYAEVAAEVDRSPQACRLEARRVGLAAVNRGRPPDLAKRTRLMALVRRGLTLKQIAALTGVHPSSAVRMAQQLVRAGLLRRTGKRRRGRYEVIDNQIRHGGDVDESANGKPLSEITGTARRDPPLTLNQAKVAVAAASPFGDVFPLLDPIDHAAFRAWYVAAEGVPVNPVKPAGVIETHTPPVAAPTGDCCSNCGGSRMVRAGACTVCLDCGTNSGCA